MHFTPQGRAIAINVAIVYGLSFFASFLVGAFFGPSTNTERLITLAVINVAAIFLGFFVAGMRVVDNYWRHLWYVALFTWLLSGFVNVAFLKQPVLTWFMSGVLIAILMGLGGGLARLTKNAPVESQAQAQVAQSDKRKGEMSTTVWIGLGALAGFGLTITSGHGSYWLEALKPGGEEFLAHQIGMMMPTTVVCGLVGYFQNRKRKPRANE